MHKLLHILSQACSIVLHPLLMPSYGIMLLFAYIYLSQQNEPTQFVLMVYSGIALAGTTLLTLLIPSGVIILMWKLKHIDSMHIENSKQRTAPYIYTIMAYAVWIYFLHSIVHLPKIVVLIAMGSCLAIVVVTIINLWWKISAHLTGIGGLIGGICAYALHSHHMPLMALTLLAIASLVLMYARLYLNAHTPLQVTCGMLLGILCTFTPPILVTSYA